MLNRKKILFFLPEDSVRTNGVYYSQCYSFARLLVKEYHAQVMIIHRDDAGPQQISFAEEARRDGIILISNLRNNSRLFIGLNTRIFDCLIAQYRQEIQEFAPTHIYVRHPLAAYSARHIRTLTRAKLIYSLRGVWPEEKAASGKWSDVFAGKLFQLYENRAVRTADEINTVSFQFREYIRKRYRREASVIPCCVSEVFWAEYDRAAIRSELNFPPDDLVVVYCGSTVFYQKFDKICELLSRLHSLLPNLKCLFLTTSQNAIEIAVNAGLPANICRHRSGSQKVVASLLSGADAGIIIRDPDLINQVSSPVKVGEYLATGLMIIGTNGIGDYSKILLENNCGVLADESSPEDIANFLKAHNHESERQARSRIARDNYSWISQHEAISRLFS